MDGTAIRPALPAEFPALAEVLEQTYTDHRELFLFPEVQSTTAALDYITCAARGDFGTHPACYTLGIWQDTQCLGLALGSQVLPALGFVLHLAVLPEARGRGLGTALLASLTENFGLEGMDYIGLGVTCDNPAVNLYKRAGFEVMAQLPVFYRASPFA
jgi:ribosomal protein S18 acetylase RimI-like enzyme